MAGKPKHRPGVPPPPPRVWPEGTHPPDRAAKFWARVHMTDDCWLWVGQKQRRAKPYGVFWDHEKRGMDSAHRYSYRVHNGPIPAGMVVMHSCDNPLCIRPDHLSVGTFAENNADMARKGRCATGDRNGSRSMPERLVRGPANHNTKLTAEQVAEARRRWLAGKASVRVIAKQLGVSEGGLRAALDGRTWAYLPMPSGQRPKGHPARLTPGSVREARARYAIGGVTIVAIARDLGMSEAAVRAMLQRRTWRHVT